MELSANISPTIALAGILSGIFLFALSLLLFHILLQRRKDKARARAGATNLKSTGRPHRGDGPPGARHNHPSQQEAKSASSFFFPSRRRGSRSRSRSDSESDDAAEGAQEDEEGKMMDGDGHHGHGTRASSFYLEPNRPLYVDVDVDVESESNDRGPQSGMQFILTPPTPGK